MFRRRSSLSGLVTLVLPLASLVACDKEPKRENPPPPPPETTAAPGACAGGGGALTDPATASFFAKSVGGYCVDPQGQVKTYGEKGQFSMDEVCTNAFDGECEVYKAFALKRVTSLRYVDGSGRGGTVEVILSQFKEPGGAYGMFTMRVVGTNDPLEPSTPKVLEAGAAGAIGTGRAYVWRGDYLAELQYVNEQESPSELAKSSDVILRAVAADLGGKLTGPTTLPAPAEALPKTHLVPNGIMFYPSDLMGFTGVGPAAVGYYKDGDRRWRVVSIVKGDADQAKDTFKTLKSKPGSLPITGVGDEAAHVVVATAGSPSVEMLVARKGAAVWAVADEEFALSAAGEGGEKAARVTKDEALAKAKTLLAAAPPPSSSATPTASGVPAATPAPSGAPAASASAPSAPSSAKH